MPTHDLIFHDVSSASLVYLPILADLIERPAKPAYALADVLHAQGWLLQCLELRLADYALEAGTFQDLLATLGHIGDLVQQLTALRQTLLTLDWPGILAGTIAEPDEPESTRADLMPDEIESLPTGG